MSLKGENNLEFYKRGEFYIHRGKRNISSGRKKERNTPTTRKKSKTKKEEPGYVSDKICLQLVEISPQNIWEKRNNQLGVKCVQANACPFQAVNRPCTSGFPSDNCHNQGPTRGPNAPRLTNNENETIKEAQEAARPSARPSTR